MKILRLALTCQSFTLAIGQAFAAGGFFGDPPDQHHPWAVHDLNRPQPPVVVPGMEYGHPPSDAIILFDGSTESFANWEHEKPDNQRKNDWVVKDGAFQCVAGAGYLMTKEKFGDCQLHLEWAAPTEVEGEGQGRGNSGVFFLDGMVEVQVLDNYENPSYADGMAGSVYGVMPPAVNALRAPGEWQSYDIIFRRPIVRDGKVLDAGSLTVLCNGVVVQDNTPLEGGGGYRFRKPLNRVFPEKGRLSLQDHGNPVRYRNIWIRPLSKRGVDGGFDGWLSTEATMAKRVDIAADIRKDAESKKGMEKAYRLLESLLYASDDAALKEADDLVADYLARFEGAKLLDPKAEKGTVLNLNKIFSYLNRHKILPPEHFAQPKVKAILDRYGWTKKK